MFVNPAGSRAVLGLAAALALLAMISLQGMLDVAASAATPKTDYAKGKGTASGNDSESKHIHFKFNVQAADTDPSTDAATGTFSLKQGKKYSPTGKKRFVNGSLSCLDTAPVSSGEAANFAGKVEDTNVPQVENGYFDFEGVDTTHGKDTFALKEDSNPLPCQPPTGNEGVPIKGNIVVKSA